MLGQHWHGCDDNFLLKGDDLMEANYLFIVSMDVDADKEEIFNEVYDTEHVPLLLKVPGVVSVKRYRTEPFDMVMAGERKQVLPGDEPSYTAIYGLDSADVLVSDEWASAVDQGRWPTHVRPFTKNRRHVLKKLSQ
ncbi:MAG: hypothetical protein ACI8PT_001235 [Gammaproteobacteria bacterium]